MAQSPGGYLINFSPLKCWILEKQSLKEIRSKVAEVELVYKSKVKASECPQVVSASEAYGVCKSL